MYDAVSTGDNRVATDRYGCWRVFKCKYYVKSNAFALPLYTLGGLWLRDCCQMKRNCVDSTR
jgi:hypothetical protein